MFEDCEQLSSLDLSRFNTSKVENMGSMFFDCTNIENLDLKNFNTSTCANMSYMFGECTKLKHVDVSSFDTRNSEDPYWRYCRLEGMFAGCESLTDLDVSNFFINKDIDIKGMFMGCSSLKYLKLFPIEIFENKWAERSYYCGDMSRLFYGCKSLEVIDLSGWHIGSPCSMNSTFANCTSLKTIYVSGEWELKYESINYVIGEYESVSYYFEIFPSDFYHVFFNCPNLTGGAGTKWNPSVVSSPAYLKIDTKSRVETKCDEETDWNVVEYLVPAVPGYFTRKE